MKNESIYSKNIKLNVKWEKDKKQIICNEKWKLLEMSMNERRKITENEKKKWHESL